MDKSATEICSPVVRSMSSSLLSGLWEISCALFIRLSVVPAGAETTTTTSFPSSLAQHCLDGKLLRKSYRFHSNYSETFETTNEATVLRMRDQNLLISFRKHTLWRGGLIIPLRQTKIFDIQIEFPVVETPVGYE